MRRTDRRAEKTRASIKEAFFELLKNKPEDSISVKEICDLANCSRNTFYVHFLYKENLYKTILDECIASILHGFKPLGKIASRDDLYLIDEYVNSFMNGIIENEEVLRIIIGSDTNHVFNRRLSERIFDTLQQSTRDAGYNNADSAQYTLMCRYTAFGFVEFSFYWLEHKRIDVSEVKSVLHDILESAMINGLKYGHSEDR